MNDPHANFDDELEYCDDMIDEFAAELTKVNLAKGSPLDAFARILFAKALDEDKAGELLGHLFDGDSVTINRQTGEFFYASSEVLKEMAAE
jgi:flagellar motor switch protein FliG